MVIFNYVTTFHDFCRDSAKQASLMALTAPKILNFQFSIIIGPRPLQCRDQRR